MGAAWRRWRDLFAKTGIETAGLDARLLAQHVLGLDGTGLALAETREMTAAQSQTLADLAERRLRGEPMARILGGREFFGRLFALNDHTLVPRPETELAVETGLVCLADKAAPKFLELGVGSGCIAVSLLAENQRAEGVASDVSDEALAMARANARAHAVAERLDLLKGSWFSPLGDEARFDLIISNPPYIAQDVIRDLAIEVRDHDPVAALDGGADGLDAYRAIAAGSAGHLLEGGALVLEIGFDQARAVTDMFVRAGFAPVACHRDLGGQDRVLHFTLEAASWTE